VWAGIINDRLVGSHVLPHRLTGNHYRDFLLHDLPKPPEVVKLAVRARLWYLHDGAPAHFSRAVRNVLNNAYHDQWIGRGPTAWPPRPPDFNPLGFLPVGTPKSPCIAALVDNEETLHLTVDACETICNFPRIFERVLRSMMR
jgi:hypothetical protein